MQNQNPCILWLPSWYPNKIQPYEGDFVQRHAQAAALYNTICVIKIVSDEKGAITKTTKIEINKQGKLTEQIIYFKKSFSLFGKMMAAYNGMNLYKRAIRNFIKENGKPSLVHVHVGMKAGVIGRWLKRRYHIPYVVTEHWSGFLKEADEKFTDLPFYYRSHWKNIFKDASGVSVVSNYLATALNENFSIPEYKIIPNVVNRNIFFPQNIPFRPGYQFIHISGLETLKNPKVILHAFAKVSEVYPSAKLEIFGSKENSLMKFVNEMHLKNNIQVHPEVPQQVLADAIRNSDALILYSAYETFGCVIIEANACGVPVIVSELPVFHETVQEGVNGIFAGNNDPDILAAKMIFLIRNKSVFDNNYIAEMTLKKYSYEVVGKQMSGWYAEILER